MVTRVQRIGRGSVGLEIPLVGIPESVDEISIGDVTPVCEERLEICPIVVEILGGCDRDPVE
jgi:hypothetical protein